jgi:DNA-binding SARP family transcriptional activator
VAKVQFRVLGSLQTRTGDGRLVRIGAVKPRLMLATLLLSANRPVSVDRLRDVIWGDHPPPSAASALRTYASALRGVLALSARGCTTRIVAGHAAYHIAVAGEDLDLLVFEELATAGQKALAEGDATGAAEHLQRALALWQGRALEDLPLEAAFEADIARLEELRLTVLEAWVGARLALGQHGELVTELRRYVAEQPMRERLYGLWMRALYREGQQAAALAAYRELRENLVRELGIEPSRPLPRLQRPILSADPTLDAPMPERRSIPIPRQLPRDAVDFVGRTLEQRWLRRILRSGNGRAAPVVAAIDGVAGVGKSALAIHAAHQVADEYPDGHLYADMHGPGAVAPLSVLNSFLRAFGGTDEIASLDEAAARFRDLTAARRVLILLDNARDVGQIQPLLPAGPGCAVLITSRRALASLVDAEPVRLDVLDPGDSVTVLGLLAGPGRVGAEPEATAEVARLCEGLPLALRIAGARLAARPRWRVRTLADRLADAHHRLDELEAGDVGVRTSFQVSLDALGDSPDPRDRAAADAFGLIAVLDTPDLGVTVAARLLDRSVPEAESSMERLVDAQLLDSETPGRYRLHDLLRLFAQERAAQRYTVAERTAALLRALHWYQITTRETLRLLRPGHQHPVLAAGAVEPQPFDSNRSALAWLTIERTNVLAAVRQALANPAVPPTIPFAIAQALFGFFQLRGYWLDWIAVNEAILPVAERLGDLAAIGYARRDLGVAHELRGDYERALTDIRAGLEVLRRAGDRYGEAACLTSLAVIDHRQGRYGDALEHTRASMAIRRDMGDARGQAVCLSNLGETQLHLGEYVQAQSCYRKSLAIFQRLGDRTAAAAVLSNLGNMYESQDRYADAVASYEQSLAITQELGDRAVEASTLHSLGRAYRRLGRYDAALARQQESLAITEPLGDRYYHAQCLRELGHTWRDLGHRDRAEQYWRLSLAHFAELDVPEAAEVRELLASP